ncbi:type II toxin-antitoxin system PemI/MazE family antitoxin [Companilactobacillus mishanensis]|uniref:Transcription elongation factor GreAB n=1 Tax=Companilactobacillus mishanensis TaxID=2486008 RepID=A0A5P0ZK30_9LACO|nr:transcription elongation factor GreAB [Companilactobacillus mishanensis]MQS53443.1 transcription elongation factor GreAB [Companilactobacillus mishanensis]
MLEVKAVQRGNSLALALPKEVNIKKGDTWLLIQDKNNGGYYLIPKIKNPYKNVKPGSMYAPEEWSDISLNEVE